MPGDSRTLVVRFVGDARQLEQTFGRVQKKTSALSKGLAVGAKVGAGALLGLGLAGKIGFDELSQHAKVAAQTGAVIKSTGGQAHVSAKQVSELATSLLNKSGVDDEVVQSGENVLLTFRRIQNEAGKGNDIFNQATKATLDLSVALGKDMTSSSLLVGKALNDPLKGMTALTRAGVQFTTGQTDQIKAMVASGDQMGAQKIILGELTKEFGGSAEAAGNTFPGQLSKLQESFKNLAGSTVATLIPSLAGVTSHLQTIVNWMQRNKQATQVLVIAIASLSTALIAAKLAYALANSSLVTFLRSERVAAVASKALAAATWLVNAALTANPVVLITAGIIALGVALVVAYKKSETFRHIVQGAMHAVSTAISTVVGWVDNLIGKIQTLVAWIGRIHFPSIPFLGGSASLPPSRGGSGGSIPQAVIRGTGGGVTVIVQGHVLDGRQLGQLVGQALRNENRNYGRANSGRSIISPT